jgi:hypothetical protein
MRKLRQVLIRVLREPETLSRLSLADWDLLVRQARQAGLLARLHGLFRERGLLEKLPQPIRWHFAAADTLACKQQIAVRWEVEQIRAALAALGFPLIVLKGAAYVVAGLPAARGRLFNDIDILVPRDQLGPVEAALLLAGWHPTGLSDYDQRYYRRWMHEIPPLQHVKRATVIDVHHAILPDTARYHPDPDKLRSRAVAVPGLSGFYVLASEDRILHSATHLFHDGDLPHGLRDLTDLDLLLRDAAAGPDFWPRLLARAGELQLRRSLFYALRYTSHFLETPIPDDVQDALRDASPNRATLALMDAVFVRALAPDHASCDDALTPVARLAAYVRAHWLRMPAHLLIPHLFHKTFVSPYLDSESPKAA